MKTDIENREDLKKLVNGFYDKVKVDAVIGYYFTTVIKVDWEKHLPTMYDFWENVLFHTDTYVGNPMIIHMAIHKKSPFENKHFKRWLLLFNETVDELFEGSNALKIKSRAKNIAAVMLAKILSK